MDKDKTSRLYRLLEDASKRVREWPDWKRSQDSKQELERLEKGRQAQVEQKKPR